MEEMNTKCLFDIRLGIIHVDAEKISFPLNTNSCKRSNIENIILGTFPDTPGHPSYTWQEEQVFLEMVKAP